MITGEQVLKCWPRSSVGQSNGDLICRLWVQISLGSKNFFVLGSLISCFLLRGSYFVKTSLISIKWKRSLSAFYCNMTHRYDIQTTNELSLHIHLWISRPVRICLETLANLMKIINNNYGIMIYSSQTCQQPTSINS